MFALSFRVIALVLRREQSLPSPFVDTPGPLGRWSPYLSAHLALLAL